VAHFHRANLHYSVIKHTFAFCYPSCIHIVRSRARRSPAYRDGTSAARAAALRRVASVGRDLRTASAGGSGPNTLAVQSIGGLSIGGQPAGHRSTVSIPSQHAAADGRTGPPAGSLAALEVWRSMLGGTPELGFTELAQLLCDRPRPARRVLDAAADAGRRSTGVDRVPAFSHALLESVVAAERLVAHFQARAAADLAELAGSYPGLREHLATEIALALGCSEGTATRRLDEAEQTARRLPGTVSARWRGLLPTPKVTALRANRERFRRSRRPGGGRRAGGSTRADRPRTADRDSPGDPAARPRWSHHPASVGVLPATSVPMVAAGRNGWTASDLVSHRHRRHPRLHRGGRRPGEDTGRDQGHRSTPGGCPPRHLHRHTRIWPVRWQLPTPPASTRAAGAGDDAAGRGARRRRAVRPPRSRPDHRRPSPPDRRRR